MIELKEKSIQSWRSKLGRFCRKKISLLLSMLRNLRKSDTTPEWLSGRLKGEVFW